MLEHIKMITLKINKASKDLIIESLESIAEDLIINKLIVINESIFSLIDIEIYYWHSMHKDDYARGVKHTRPIGEFEVHRYGIDISLGNQENRDFGGILIRGLYDINNNKVIKKSEVIKTLFNHLIQGNNHFEFINDKSPWKHIFKTKRLNLGDPDNSNKKEYSDSRYRILAKDKEIFVKYPDKEIIIRESNLDDKDRKYILDYKL